MNTELQVHDVRSDAGLAALAGGSRPMRVNQKTGQVKIATSRGLVINSALRKDEWEELDRAVLESKKIRLRALQDVRDRGLTYQLGGLGSLVSQWNTTSEMTGPSISMTGQSMQDRDRTDFDLAGVPIPVIHKEFGFGERQLQASRQLGDGLDVTNLTEAVFVVSEQMEDMLINGYDLTFGGYTIRGYTTLPARNSGTAGDFNGGDWGTIANIVPTVAGMITAAELEERSYGPFVLYVANTQYNEAALTFYGDNTGQTPLQRIMMMPQIEDVRSLDKLAAGEALLVELNRTTVDWAQAMDVTVMEWTSHDGMSHTFKVMAVGAPRVKGDYNGRTGIVHATGI